MKRPLGSITAPFILADLLVGLALTVAVSRPASAQSAPTNLRVDISDGNTGQLFVSWYQVSGATYYNVERSATSATGPWTVVANCSGASNIHVLRGPLSFEICRDNNGGNPTLTPGTTYYYQVQACDSTPCTGTWTTGTYANIPVTCNCTQGSTSSQIPPMRGLEPPESIPGLEAGTVTGAGDNAYQYMDDEVAAYPVSPSTNYRGVLVVGLPGSGEGAGRTEFLWTAQNMGFDVMSIGYYNQYPEENICDQNTDITTDAEAAACFTNLSQAKLNFTGPCIPGGGGTNTTCGTVPDGSKDPFTMSAPYDDIVVRIGTLLQYLWCSNPTYDTTYTKWESYLGAGSSCSTVYPIPNWSKIILVGTSQGGGMATFAADELPIIRAVNLSAPAQATPIDGTMVAASYFSDFTDGVSQTGVGSIFGLVSQNDTGFYDPPKGVNQGVFEAVWQAIGFDNPANNDAEWKLNVAGSLQPLVCSSTASNNFSTDAPVSPEGGHADPTLIWNEDVFEYMLID